MNWCGRALYTTVSRVLNAPSRSQLNRLPAVNWNQDSIDYENENGNTSRLLVTHLHRMH
jgi:hypothetical protein